MYNIAKDVFEIQFFLHHHLKLPANPKQNSFVNPFLAYSRVRNKHSRTLINFLTFIQGLRPYSGLHSIR